MVVVGQKLGSVPQYPQIEQHCPGKQSASDTHSPSPHSLGLVAQNPLSQHHGLSFGQSFGVVQSSVDSAFVVVVTGSFVVGFG